MTVLEYPQVLDIIICRPCNRSNIKAAAVAIFAILMPTPQPLLIAKIVKVFPNDYLRLNETQYLISSSRTVQSLAMKLGLGAGEQGQPITGSAVIFATSSYWGRAPTPVWDWMKAKLEASQSDQ